MLRADFPRESSDRLSGSVCGYWQLMGSRALASGQSRRLGVLARSVF
jgi:hypothetical protein